MAGLGDGLDEDLPLKVLGLEEGCSHVSAAHDPLVLDSNEELHPEVGLLDSGGVRPDRVDLLVSMLLL